MKPRTALGIVSVLQHDGDPRGPWKATEIDRLTTSHRLRWADIYGNGKKVLMNAPLTGAHAEAPEYRDHTPLVFYRPGEWKRELIGEENEGVVHGIYVIDWDGDGRDDILTASFVGIDLYKLGKDGRWTRTEIAKGDPAAWPKSGSSDVAVGRTGGERYIAAIEPWHGNQVAVYRQKGAGVAAARDRRFAGRWAHDLDGGSERRWQRRDHRRLSRRKPQRVHLLSRTMRRRAGRSSVLDDGRHGSGGVRGGRSEWRRTHRRGVHRVGDGESEVV